MVKYCKRVTCRKLRCSDLDLTHDDSSLFIKSQVPFDCGHWIAIIWNSVWGIFFITVMILDIFHYTVEQRHLWLIFLSNWAFLLTVGTTIVEGVVRMCIIQRLNSSAKEDARGMVWCQKIQWTFYNMNNVVSIITSIFYFSLSEIDMSLPNVSKHVLTSVYVILNTSFISSLPVKPFHFYQSAIFFISYAIFIFIYQEIAPKTSLFLELDLDKPLRSAILLSCGVVIGCPLVHIFFYSVFLIRTYVFKKCSGQDSSVSQPSPIQRDITATDVILEDSGSPNFVDIKPEVKDDIALKAVCANGDAFKRFNGRLYKSETDLQDYRLKNGLFCEFAKSSLIFHKSPNSKSTNDIFENDNGLENSIGNKTPEYRGSQIIVVKKYKNCETENSESESTSSGHDSDASSDFLSQYITEDILAYL